MTERRWVVIGGGGTAGHVLPAIAVAQALVADGCPVHAIEFVGSERGLETRLVPEAGFSLTTVPGRGFTRAPSFANVKSAVSLGAGSVQGIGIVRRLRPAVVLSVGGYAAFPAVLGARLASVPLVVLESNAVPGAVNRFAARFATACAVSYDTSLPKSVLTGNPVRREILSVDRSPEGRLSARKALGLSPERHVVAAFGGSLGSRRINQATVELVNRWRGRGDIAVFHVVGSRDWLTHKDSVKAEALQYRPVEYEAHMETVYQAADVVVCRAGGTTVAELAVTGVPALFVPLPTSPGDHQSRNAAALVATGGARVVPDDACNGERLAIELELLLDDPIRLTTMSECIRSVGRPHASQAVAKLLIEKASRGWEA